MLQGIFGANSVAPLLTFVAVRRLDGFSQLHGQSNLSYHFLPRLVELLDQARSLSLLIHRLRLLHRLPRAQFSTHVMCTMTTLLPLRTRCRLGILVLLGRSRRRLRFIHAPLRPLLHLAIPSSSPRRRSHMVVLRHALRVDGRRPQAAERASRPCANFPSRHF